jgi:methylphosphotriester-DNA--protein-cysteine methyltransferase
MQHVEFFHKEHFDRYYHRVIPPADLSHFIDFFWETDFDTLWNQYPQGFSDALFPNVGYTYLINLGTPFVMQLEDRNFEMKTDGFLPRHTCLECYHRPGNKIFGIKFKISPVIFEKKINFREYREYIFPLSYLVDQTILDNIKNATHFKERVQLLVDHYQPIVKNNREALHPIQVVTEILDDCFQNNSFTIPIEERAAKYRVSCRTLQRYFEMTTSISSKKALQIMRIRKVTAHIASSPDTFHYSTYGYYDHSHFYKHLKKFLHKNTLQNLQPHLRLLSTLHLK